MGQVDKNTKFENFTISLALFDALPVIFFSLASIFIGLSIESVIFVVGAIITFLSGSLKVIWKIIVATKKKNIWPLFIQMRIVMPLGFLIMLVGFIVCLVNKDLTSFWQSLLNPVSIIFLIVGFLGMILMTIFAVKLDSSDSLSNWIEQGTNAISQIAFFIAFLIAFILK